MTGEVFIAREHELTQLEAFLDRALSGQGAVVFITGEAGAGKTTLVTEFTRQAQETHTDLLVALGNCNARTGLGDPYLPFREALGLLTGDVEDKLAQGAILPENARRLKQFFQVSGEVLVELGPMLINTLVPGAGLVSRAGIFLAGKLGWLDRLKKLTTEGATENPE